MKKLFSLFYISSAFAFWPFESPPLNFYEASQTSMLSSLSIEEKVGQVFMAPLHATKITPEIRAHLKRSKLGNIILYNKTNGLRSSSQIRQLTAGIYQSIMDTVRIPPLIGSDEEGGYVRRLLPITHFPSARAIGATGEPAHARAAYKAMGLEARALGVNIFFAPVVDLHTNKQSTLLATRSFGSDPEIVTAFGKAALEGLKEAEMLSVLKHAPGHGPVSEDTHLTGAHCVKTLNELDKSHWIPFKELSPIAPAMMSAHVTYEAIDPDLPATLSPTLIQTLIRNRWSFNGVIFSDSLTMGALIHPSSSAKKVGAELGRLAIDAFNAGCDCCLIGPLKAESYFTQTDYIEAIESAMDTFIEAIKIGKISESRLDESVARLLKMKEQIPLLKPVAINYKDHLQQSQTIAEEALTLLSDPALFEKVETSLYGKRIILLIPQTLETGLEKILSALQFLLNVEEVKVHVIGSEESSHEVDEILEAAPDVDLVFFLSRDITSFPVQAEMAKALAKALPPERLIFASLSNPWELADLGLHKTHLVYLTYSRAPSSLIALAKALNHHLLPRGYFPLFEKETPCENGVCLAEERP